MVCSSLVMSTELAIVKDNALRLGGNRRKVEDVSEFLMQHY